MKKLKKGDLLQTRTLHAHKKGMILVHCKIYCGIDAQTHTKQTFILH